MTLVEIIIAVLLPPLAVFMRRGLRTEFWLCLLLTLLAWIPGVIYAIFVVSRDR